MHCHNFCHSFICNKSKLVEPSWFVASMLIQSLKRLSDFLQLARNSKYSSKVDEKMYSAHSDTIGLLFWIHQKFSCLPLPLTITVIILIWKNYYQKNDQLLSKRRYRIWPFFKESPEKQIILVWWTVTFLQAFEIIM